jgi:hypothetical protein
VADERERLGVDLRSAQIDPPGLDRTMMLLIPTLFILVHFLLVFCLIVVSYFMIFIYCCMIALFSIAYLKVQNIRNEFAVNVYETHARLCIGIGGNHPDFS